MTGRKLCPPETFSIIHHYKRKLLAYNNGRRNKGKLLGRIENCFKTCKTCKQGFVLKTTGMRLEHKAASFHTNPSDIITTTNIHLTKSVCSRKVLYKYLFGEAPSKVQSPFIEKKCPFHTPS